VAHYGFVKVGASAGLRRWRRRGVRCGVGLSPSHWRRGLGRVPYPSPYFLNFWFKIFGVQAKGGSIAQCLPKCATGQVLFQQIIGL